MIRRLVFVTIAAFMLTTGVTVPAVQASSVNSSTESVVIQGETFQVQLVRIDLTDPMLQLVPVVAAEGMGYQESFQSMVNRTSAVAAVNGTFFDTESDEAGTHYPSGLMIAGGRTVHSGEGQALILMDNRQPVIRNISLGVRITFVKGSATYTYFPWGINEYYGADAQDQFVMFTPDMDRLIDYSGTKIIVRENMVTEITEDAVVVPSDGFVVFIGNSENNRRNLLPLVSVGDKVDVERIARNAVSGQPVSPSNWMAAIGGGPKLLTSRQVDINIRRDGFDDVSILQESMARSFVGTDADGNLVMGTVDDATLVEAAEVARALGLVDAMNLDGGASSGLYADGQMLVEPSGNLSNALVVRRLVEPLIQIEVNGRFIPDFQGFIRNNITLVPVRPLLQVMGAEFIWDESASHLRVSKDGRTLVLTPGNSTVVVNGRRVTLDTPPVIVDGRMYVPIRFMIETWGGIVRWNPELYRVSVEIGG